jgi:hypothetical protein
MLTRAEWITERRPTEVDANEYGDVRVLRPKGDDWDLVQWDQVHACTPWCHSSSWRPEPAKRVAALERRVAELQAEIKAVSTVLELLRGMP